MNRLYIKGVKPIISFSDVCAAFCLTGEQEAGLQELIQLRKSVIHPYWIQIALFMPRDLAKRLYDELIGNEWAVPDEVEIDGAIYETELSDSEIELIAYIELEASSYSSSH